MSTETQTQEQPKLTANDPLDAQTLKRFEEMQGARMQLAERILDLEQEKIKTLRAAQNVDLERQRLFETVLVSRGIPPAHPVRIDAQTGVITLVEPLPNTQPASA